MVNSQYTGSWYQVSGLPAFFQPSGSSCVRANYGANGKRTIVIGLKQLQNFEIILRGWHCQCEKFFVLPQRWVWWDLRLCWHSQPGISRRASGNDSIMNPKYHPLNNIFSKSGSLPFFTNWWLLALGHRLLQFCFSLHLFWHHWSFQVWVCLGVDQGKKSISWSGKYPLLV